MRNLKHNLQIESKKDKKGKGLLYFNFNYGYYEINSSNGKKKYKALKFSTGYRLEKNDLKNGHISKKYISKNGRTIKTDLAQLEDACHKCFNDFTSKNNQLPSPQILKQMVKNELNGEVKKSNSDSIVEFIEKLIHSNKNISSTSREYLSTKAIDEYINTRKKLESLEKISGEKLTFGSFTKDKYYETLKKINDLEISRQLENGEIQKGFSNNYISKISKNILAILNKAGDNEFKIQFNTRGKKVNEVESKCNTYFKEEEIELIIKSNVSFSKTLQAAKDYVIISCLTGLRLEDMENLNLLKVEKFGKNGSSFMGIKTLIRKASKAHSKVTAVIPVFVPVMDVYKANNNSFPKFQSNISKYIKKLCEHLEINDEVEEKILYYLEDEPRITLKPKHRMVSAHKCRSSFITNLKMLGISNVLTSEITHPKKDLSNMYSRYDNSSVEDTARLLIEELKKKNSKLYS